MITSLVVIPVEIIVYLGLIVRTDGSGSVVQGCQEILLDVVDIGGVLPEAVVLNSEL